MQLQSREEKNKLMLIFISDRVLLFSTISLSNAPNLGSDTNQKTLPHLSLKILNFIVTVNAIFGTLDSF